MENFNSKIFSPSTKGDIDKETWNLTKQWAWSTTQSNEDHPIAASSSFPAVEEREKRRSIN